MRNVKKSVDEYIRKFGGTNKGKFYQDEVQEINEISQGKKWDCIANALMFGFMVGYRFAKNERR